MRPLIRNTTNLSFALLLSLLSAIAAPCFAERLPVKIYTSADGLGSSASFNLVRDARGFIWLCSRDGLIRFDGYRFITYQVGSDAEPSVFSLVPTREGSYWINLNRGTDYRFLPQSDTTVLKPMSQSLVKNDPRILLSGQPVTDTPLPNFEDSAGNLWVADDNGMSLLREVNGQLTALPIELKLPISPGTSLSSFAFTDGRDGALWVGTNWGLTQRLPDGRLLHFGLNPHDQTDPVRYFAEDKESRVWVARPNGLLVLKVAEPSQLSYRRDGKNETG